MLPSDQGDLNDIADFGDTFEPEDLSVLAGFFDVGAEEDENGSGAGINGYK